MKKLNKWLFPIAIVVLTVLTAIPAKSLAQNNADKLQQRHDSMMSPIIMIPGSSASINRFDTFG